MPIPTATCLICGNTVNKRQTILVDKGRVCREHQEAKDHQQALEQAKAQEAKAKEDKEKTDAAMQNVNCIMLTEQIRMMAYHEGKSLNEVANFVLRSAKKDLREKVMDELYRIGPMREEEVTAAALMAVELIKRGMV